MKLIRFVLRYSKGMLIAAVVTGIISGLCSTGLLAIINSALHQSGTPLARTVYLFAALVVAAPLTRALSEIVLLVLAQDTFYKLRIELSNKVLKVPLRQLEEIGASRVLAILTEDLSNMANFVSLIPVLAINLAIVSGCLMYMGFLSFRLLLIVLGFMIVAVLSYQISIIKAVQNLRAARQENDRLMSQFQSLLQGIKELKLHRRRRASYMNDTLTPTAASLRKRNISGFGIYTIASIWGQFLVFILVGILTLFISSLVEVDDKTLTGFVLVLFYLVNPLQVMMNIMPQIGRANVSVANIDDMGLTLDGFAAENETKALEELKPSWESLEFSEVTYAYRGEVEEQFVLGPLNVKFRPGEIIFLAGGNGSGKTTLAKLLVGLYTPDSGEILFNGEEVIDLNRDDYRQYFSAIFFDFHLFDELLGFDGQHLDDRAGRYLQQLHLRGKVSVNDGKLSTTDLSQGQRKRLALLTAYLEDRPIYLFDEWAADQDPVFKEIFYREILAELRARGKTVIVISHDDRYYAVGDRVIKMEGGCIVSDDLATSDHKTAFVDRYV